MHTHTLACTTVIPNVCLFLEFFYWSHVFFLCVCVFLPSAAFLHTRSLDAIPLYPQFHQLDGTYTHTHSHLHLVYTHSTACCSFLCTFSGSLCQTGGSVFSFSLSLPFFLCMPPLVSSFTHSLFKHVCAHTPNVCQPELFP